MFNLFKSSTLLSIVATMAVTVGASSAAEAEGTTKAPVGQQTKAPKLTADALRVALFTPWKTKYAALTQTAASAMQSNKPDNYAAQLHMLELELVHIMKLAAADKHMSPKLRTSTTQEARSLLTQLQWNYPSLQMQMRQRFEAANPGKSGAQLVTRTVGKNGKAVDVFAPSFHSKKKLSKVIRDKLSKELTAKHKAKHPGELIHQPLNSKTVPDVKSGELLEWVVTPESKKGKPGELRVTRNAKHVVTSGGLDTLAAGSLKIIWHPEHVGVPQKALAVMVSNWSGTFQPDMASLESTMVARLSALKFPRESIILTPTMPLEPKMYEILLSMRKSKVSVVTSLKRLDTRIRRQQKSTSTHWGKTVKRFSELRQATVRSRATHLVANSNATQKSLKKKTRSRTVGTRKPIKKKVAKKVVRRARR